MIVNVSASQIQHLRDCERAWAFRKVDRVPDETDDSARRFGIAGHALAEGWLREGKDPGESIQGRLIKKAIAKGLLPTPSPELEIERDLTMVMLNGWAVLYGYADVVVRPGVQGAVRPRIHDHKFTSGLRWAMDEDELADDAQAVTYAKYAIERWPEADGVDVGWIYYEAPKVKAKGDEPRDERGFLLDDAKEIVRKVGAVRGVSRTLLRPRIEEAWLRVADDVERMVAIKLAGLRAIQVEPTGAGRSCDKFNGCPYRTICPITPGQRLSARMRQMAKGGGRSLTMIASDANQTETTVKEIPVGEAMTMVQKMKAKYLGGGNGVPPPAPPETKAEAPAVAAAPIPPPAPKVEAPAPVDGAKESLVARMRARAAATTAPAAEPAINPPPVPASAAPTTPPPASTPAPEAKVQTPATAPAAEAAKAPRAKKAKEAAPAASVLAVYVDCAFRKGAPDGAILLGDFLAPVVAKTCAELGVAHPGLVDFKKGWYALAANLDHALTADRATGAIVVDSRTDEWSAVSTVLQAHADVVVGAAR